MVAKCD